MQNISLIFYTFALELSGNGCGNCNAWDFLTNEFGRLLNGKEASAPDYTGN
jgi:hypothetical protein